MSGYGIGKMVVHSGYMAQLYDVNWFSARSVDFWKEFLEDKPDDFALYLENVFEPNPDMLCEIVGAVGDERFKLCLDIGHSATSGAKTPMSEWIERFAPALGHVHLHNNYGDYDTHNALGLGGIDVASAIRGIAGTAPGATFAIEASDGQSSVDWLVANGFLK
jgi:sugar phosphate isomerase/epimerase